MNISHVAWAQELKNLEYKFELESGRAKAILEEMAAGRDKNHGTHNLLSAVHDMTTTAAKIEMAKLVLRDAEESDEAARDAETRAQAFWGKEGA